MCHSLNEDKIGPALAGATQRWGGDTSQLKGFIKNAQSVINSGDAYAISLYNKWNRSNMPAFPNLTDQELNALLEYLR
jgi:cytochrome c551/c552